MGKIAEAARGIEYVDERHPEETLKRSKTRGPVIGHQSQGQSSHTGQRQLSNNLNVCAAQLGVCARFQSETPSVGSASRGRITWCSKCERKHLGQYGKKKRNCYFCRQSDHMIAECPQRLTVESQTGQPRASGSFEGR